jgi:hypothetical protein
MGSTASPAVPLIFWASTLSGTANLPQRLAASQGWLPFDIADH